MQKQLKKILVFSGIISCLLSPGVLTASPLTAKEIYKNYSRAVVLIMAWQEGEKGSSIGTGSIIETKGGEGSERLILTNAHVIYDEEENKPMSNIRVYLRPEKITGRWKDDINNPHKASILAYNAPLDLALLKVAGDIGDNTIKLADSETVEVGEAVIAIGHPEQGGLWTLTTGTISAQKSDLDGVKGKDVFQTDASINRGNSGGPLLNMNGGLVGVNTSIARRSTDGLAITGINFSLKAGTVKNWMKTEGYTADHQTIAALKVKPEPPVKEKPVTKEKPAKGEPDKETKSDPEKKDNIITRKNPYTFDDLIEFLMRRKEMDYESNRRLDFPITPL